MIVLPPTLSTTLERVVASHLSAQGLACSFIHPLRCCSLPGRITTNAALVVQDHIESFHHLRHKVSTLILDIKGGFDNVESPALLSRLRRKGMSPYLLQLVESFLQDCTCHLSSLWSLWTFAPVSIGVPHGSPILHLLLVIYVASRYLVIPRIIIISCVDDFAVTFASPFYKTNIRLL